MRSNIAHRTSSLVDIIAWLDRRDFEETEKHLFRFESRDNSSDKQRGVLGSSLLEEADVLLGLGARVVTEAT